jgi:putative transposase
MAQVDKRHGVSKQTIYTWRRHFSCLNVDAVKKLCQLEQVNARLKKPPATRDLEVEVKTEIAAEKW